MKKLFAVSFLVIALPLSVSAATVAELQAQLATLMAQISALQSQTPSTVVSQINTSCPNLTRNLTRGMKGTDVTSLQQFLISQKLLAADSATGFFGALTEAAVKQWQAKQGIASSGTPSTTGYGAVGPRTRDKIVVLCKGQSSAVPNIQPSTNSPASQTQSTSYSQATYYSQGSYTPQTVTVQFPTIDVGAAITAFARKHPTEVKSRTQHITTGAGIVDWVHNDAIVERFPFEAFNVWDQVVVTSIGDSTRPGWIHDLYKITPTQIVLKGTYQKANQVFLTLDPGISMARSTIRSMDDAAPLTSTVSVYSGLDAHLTETGKTVPTNVTFETIDVGGSIGKRWTLVFNFRDNNPDMPNEHWYVDLGPSENIFAPEYGFIAYKQDGAFKNSANTSYETYGTLTTMLVHETDLGSFFTY